MKVLKLKKFFVILFIVSGSLLTFHSRLCAQDFKITTYVERTYISPKMGMSAGYRFGCSFEAGGFYQKEIQSGFSEQPEKCEHEFYGMYFSIPVLCREKFGLDFMIRSGMVNKENFTITPSLNLDYRPFRILGIGGGIGLRNLRPTFMPRIEIMI